MTPGVEEHLQHVSEQSGSSSGWEHRGAVSCFVIIYLRLTAGKHEILMSRLDKEHGFWVS